MFIYQILKGWRSLFFNCSARMDYMYALDITKYLMQRDLIHKFGILKYRT